MASLRLFLRPRNFTTCLRTTRAFTSSRRCLDQEPILPSLRNDLKTAMKSKNIPQASVLRALLADLSLNEKTNGPTTSEQFLSLLKKQIASSQASQQQFKDNGREDLASREKVQEQLLQGYLEKAQEGAGGLVGLEEVKAKVEEVTKEGAMKMGDVMKKVLAAFEGRVVDKAEVAKTIKQTLGGK